MPKNRGFNKQGLEKAGIVMQGNGLALSPEVQMQMLQKQEEENRKRQEISFLINFRRTCAMNNLGCLLGAYTQAEADRLSSHKEENCEIAREYAEQLMVELKMIPDTQFFRDLEAQADKEIAEQKQQQEELSNG